jgi:hypothetical protein
VQDHRRRNGWHECRATGRGMGGTSAGLGQKKGSHGMSARPRAEEGVAQAQGHMWRKGWHKCRAMGEEGVAQVQGHGWGKR